MALPHRRVILSEFCLFASEEAGESKVECTPKDPCRTLLCLKPQLGHRNVSSKVGVVRLRSWFAFAKQLLRSEAVTKSVSGSQTPRFLVPRAVQLIVFTISRSDAGHVGRVSRLRFPRDIVLVLAASFIAAAPGQNALRCTPWRTTAQHIWP